MSHSVLYHFWSRDWFTLTSFKGLGQIINHFFSLYFINKVSLAHWMQRREWAGLQQMDVSVNHTHSWCSLREILKWSMLQLKKNMSLMKDWRTKMEWMETKPDLSVAQFLCFQLSIIRRASCLQLLTSVAQLRISLPTWNIVHLINFFISLAFWCLKMCCCDYIKMVCWVQVCLCVEFCIFFLCSLVSFHLLKRWQ